MMEGTEASSRCPYFNSPLVSNRGPPGQRCFDHLRHVRVGLLKFLQPFPDHTTPNWNTAPRVRHGLMKPLPASQSLGHGVGEEVAGNPVIVPAIRGHAHLLQYSSLLQKPRVGAYARLAHSELDGQVIQRACLLADQQEAKDPPCNPG